MPELEAVDVELPSRVEESLEKFGESHLENPGPDLLDALDVKEYGSTGEKETFLRLDSQTGTAHVSTSDGAPMRSLLEHEHAEIHHVHLSKQDGELYISGVTADLPLGTVTVKRKPRKSSYLSKVFP